MSRAARPQERSTCRHCGQPIARRAHARRWWHITGDAGLSCRPDGAGTATPTDASSALRVLLLALLAAGVSEIDLYDDGFEITGPDDRSLVFVCGGFSTEQLAAVLGVDEGTVTDLRTASASDDTPCPLPYDVTTIGRASAWRHLAAPGDLSDTFVLRALGVEVGIQHRRDCVLVTVDGDGDDPDHEPLTVQVDQGPIAAYDRSRRTR